MRDSSDKELLGEVLPAEGAPHREGRLGKDYRSLVRKCELAGEVH